MFTHFQLPKVTAAECVRSDLTDSPAIRGIHPSAVGHVDLNRAQSLSDGRDEALITFDRERFERASSRR